ncbi:MAG: PKD domain-containing protein, partial [Ardenticatenales bacterium]|nr:PKD domain-containing protein [Ardenticatenales bacterium]
IGIVATALPGNTRTYTFLATVGEGSGTFDFTWNFGDGTTAVGQEVEHQYTSNGVYLVSLNVKGEPCPVTREARSTTNVTVTNGDYMLYLPLLSSVTATRITSAPTGTQRSFEAPSIVTKVRGATINGQSTSIRWSPNHVAESILGYRIYRTSRTGREPFQHVATVPATTTTYLDQSTGCGQIYYVAAFNVLGESLRGAGAYFSPPCDTE